MTMFVRRTILAIVVAYALAFVALPAWNRSRQLLLLQKRRACEQEWWAAEKAMSIGKSVLSGRAQGFVYPVSETDESDS